MKPTTTELLEAMSVLAEAGIVVITDNDPVKIEKAAQTKNGKVLVLEPAKAVALATRYKAAEVEAANAKTALENIKEEVQDLLGDATELMVEGMTEPIATWRWGALTEFDKAGLTKEAPELVAKYTSTDPEGKRTFRFPGVKTTR